MVAPLIKYIEKQQYNFSIYENYSGNTCQNTVGNIKGTHAWNYNYSLQEVDTSTDFTLVECDMQFLNQNRKLHSDFDSRNWKIRLRTKMNICLIRLLGLHKVREIVKTIQKYKHNA